MLKDLLHAIKEYIIEYISHRLFIISMIFFVLFAMLIGRLFKLQIVEGTEHLNNFTYKSKKTLTVEAARGNIYDRNGNLLAYNQLAYSVTFENSSKLTEVAYENGVSENDVKNAVVANTIRILEKNGDSICVSIPIALSEDDKFYFTTETETERLRFLADVYGFTSPDELKEEQKNSRRCFSIFCRRKEFQYLTGIQQTGSPSDPECAICALAESFSTIYGRYNCS